MAGQLVIPFAPSPLGRMYRSGPLRPLARVSHAAVRIPDPRTSDLEISFPPGHPQIFVHEGARQALERRASEEEGAEGWAVCVRPTGEWLAVSRRQASAVRDALAAGGL